MHHRLLTAETVDGQEWISVAPEALLSAWPPLRTALDDHATALRAARSVEQAAAEWHQAGRAADYLWDADRLAAARASFPAQDAPAGDPTPSSLSPTGQVFLAATRHRVHAARTRRRRRQASTIGILSALLAVALVAAGLAVVQRQQAVEERQHAEAARRTAVARSLDARADTLRANDPYTALQLAIAACVIDPTIDTTNSLVNAVTEAGIVPFPRLTDATSDVVSVALSPDGRTLAAGGGEDGMWLWDLSDRGHPRRLDPPLAGPTEPPDAVWSGWPGHWAVFSPDGRTLAAGGGDGQVWLWDLGPLYRLREDPLGQACNITDGGLDRAAWRAYIVGLDYRKTCKKD